MGIALLIKCSRMGTASQSRYRWSLCRQGFTLTTWIKLTALMKTKKMRRRNSIKKSTSLLNLRTQSINRQRLKESRRMLQVVASQSPPSFLLLSHLCMTFHLSIRWEDKQGKTRRGKCKPIWSEWERTLYFQRRRRRDKKGYLRWMRVIQTLLHNQVCSMESYLKLSSANSLMQLSPSQLMSIRLKLRVHLQIRKSKYLQ